MVQEREESRGGEEEDEDDEEVDEPELVLPSVPSVPSTPPVITSTRAKLEEPEPSPVPEPRSPSPVPAPSSPTPAPRRSARERNAPDRLELNSRGKTYANAVVYGRCAIGLRGGKDVSPRGVRPDRGDLGVLQGDGGSHGVPSGALCSVCK